MEGFLSAASAGGTLNDEADNALQIVPHVGHGNAQSADALISTPPVPALIAAWMVAELMRKAVDLNGKSSFKAKEVERVDA